MRPLELSLQGFTSFRTEQTLRFDELDLFAITGPTGAGKSSLLDAMTFALYGHTMRSGKQDAELVSQGATEMKVAFSFIVRGRTYRITRTWRFRPSLPDVKVRLEKQAEDGQWEVLETKDRAVAKAVEQIVGMDYDTFTRVILLPQGKFDEFLKGDAPKRRELLRQLGGHEIYERMRAEAAAKLKGAKAEREALAAQMEAQLAPGPLEIAEREARLAAAEAALPALQAAARQAAQALDDAEALLRHQTRLAGLKAEQAALADEAGAIAETREKLEAAQRADRLQGPWTRLETARAAATETAAALASATAREAAARTAGEAAEAALAEATSRAALAEPGFKAREQRLGAARGLEAQRAAFAQDAAGAREAEAARAKGLAEADAALKKAEAAAEGARQRAEAAGAAVAAHRPAGPRLAALNELAGVLGGWNALVAQIKALQRRMKEARAEFEAAEAAHAAAAEALDGADRRLAAAREALEAARAAAAQRDRDGQAAALRAHLHAGDACPVCAGTFPGADKLAPLPRAGAADLAAPEAAERQADAAQRQAERELTRAGGLVEGLARKLAEFGEEHERMKTEGAAMRATINATLGETEWNVDDLEAERKALAESHARHQEALEALQRADAERREADQAADHARERRAEAGQAAAEATEAAARQAARVQALDDQLAVATGGLPVAQLEAALEAERGAIAALVAAAQKDGEAARAEAAAATEALRHAGKAAADAGAAATAAGAAWTEALAAAGLDEAGFHAAHATPADQQAWRAAVDRHAAEASRVEALAAEVEALVAGRTVDAGSVDALKAAHDAAEGGLRDTQHEAAGLRAWLEQAAMRRRESEALVQRHDEALAAEQTWSTLARDLRATDFQAYLLEHLQAELVARATVLLRELTDGRYALVMREGEFWIEDNWNGGEARRVRTLSGGETFATSLSMALALSERLSQGAELGSLFLDEGFGTLDPETLEAVTQILESLRHQNRLIGVITHVKALGERLPTQVRVTKSPNGSALKVEAL